MRLSSEPSLLPKIALSGLLLSGCGDAIESAFWKSQELGKQTLTTEQVQSVKIEFIGEPEDQAKIAPVQSVLQDLLSTMPLPMDPTVHTLKVIFSDSSAGDAQAGTDGFTQAERLNGVQVLVLNEGANPDVIAHELVHSLWQSSASKQLPGILSEGVAYHFRDPNPTRQKPAVAPEYLLQEISGLYTADGDLSRGLDNENAVEYLQYDVLRALWSELNGLDPSLTSRLLQTQEVGNDLNLDQIPDYILLHTSEDTRDEVSALLASYTLFRAPEAPQLFVMPRVKDGHPAITIYYIDSDQHALPEPLSFWYQSEKSGVVLSTFKTTPTLTRSNEELVFKKTPVEAGVEFRLVVEVPSDAVREEFSFVYDSAASRWTQD